jgi:hypothetical protein
MAKGQGKTAPKGFATATVRAPTGRPLARIVAVPKPKAPKGKGK